MPRDRQPRPLALKLLSCLCLGALSPWRAASASTEPLPPGPEAGHPVQFRALTLQRALRPLNHWGEGNYTHEKLHPASNATARLSQDLFPCGGQNVPLIVIEYDVPGARPVDVVNVLLDCPGLSSWNTGVLSCEFIKDSRVRQARGVRIVEEMVRPYPRRLESTVWQVLNASVSREEFLYIETNSENEDLYEKSRSNPLMTSVDMCLSATRITKGDSGAHIQKIVHLYPHYTMMPFKDFYEDGGFSAIAQSAADLQARAKIQNKKDLPISDLQVEPWLTQGQCVRKAPDTPYKDGLLELASFSLQREHEEETEIEVVLGDGRALSLSLSRERSPCGGRDVEEQPVPVWRGAFTLPDVGALEVFAVLAGRLEEPRWHRELLSAKVPVGGVRGGVRELLLQYSYNVSGAEVIRGVSEWQAASHTVGSGTYLLASRSEHAGETDAEVVARKLQFQFVLPAMNCLSAFEISHAESGNDTTVQFSIHVNPNFGPEWEAELEAHGRSYAISLAEDLAMQVARLQEAQGQPSSLNPLVDDGLLALLVPPTVDSNPEATLSRVLRWPNPALAFTVLNLPQALDASSWTSFEDGASTLLELLRLLEPNCTDAERLIFDAGAARDDLELLLQGEVLGSVQQKVVAQVYEEVCGVLPPRDNPAAERSSALFTFLVVAAAVLVVSSVAASVAVSRSEKRRLVAAETRVNNEAEALAEARAANSFARGAANAIFGSNFSIRSGGNQSVSFGSTTSGSSDVELFSSSLPTSSPLALN